MLINHQHNFVYLAIPRTASTSITRCLYDYFPGSKKMGHHRMDVPAECRDYFIFATVRNPYWRLLSHYRHRHKHYSDTVGTWTFSDYVQVAVERRFSQFGLNNDEPCVLYPRHYYVTHFLRVEDLETEWFRLPFLEDNPIALPILNQSQHQCGEYTVELADLVYEFYKEDFVRFDYERESWRA